MALSDRYRKRFIDAYIETALWSSTDESTPSGGFSLDQNYGPDDIAPETYEQMVDDAVVFMTENEVLLDESGLDAERAGHDMWLTRNGHGAGYWDEGLGELGDRLTDAAHAYGSFDLYVGDDGMIHGS